MPACFFLFGRTLRPLFFVAAFLFAFISCGSNEDTPLPMVLESVAGRAMKGPVVGGEVTVYALNSDGSRGLAMTTATATDEDGYFSFAQSFSGPIELVVTGGTYADEATGIVVDLTDRELNVMLPTGLAAGKVVALTPLTSAAAVLARGEIAGGRALRQAIIQANTEIASRCGLSSIDITATLPHDLTDATENALPTDQASLYAAAIAALSQFLEDNGIAPENLLALADNLGEDLIDGELDGLAGGAPLANTLTVSPVDFLGDIEALADEFLDSAENLSGLNADHLTLEPAAEVITGRAFKGPVVAGAVTVYELRGDASRRSSLATATTDALGYFTLQQEFFEAIELVVAGGTYIDDASGATVDLTGLEMSVMLADGLRLGDEVAITPLTWAAATEARKLVANGAYLSTAIAQGNADIGEQFGLADLDITRVMPVDLGSADENAQAGADATNYGAAIAALSQQIKNSGLAPKIVLELAENIGADLADGTLDGEAGIAMLPNNLAVTPPQFTNNLELLADQFLAGDFNLSGITADDVTLKDPYSRDKTAPEMLTAFSESGKTTSTWTGSATVDELAFGFCTALVTGSPTPTAAEVKGDNNANQVGTGGTVTMIAEATEICTISGLVQGTTYDFYFVAEDIFGNLQGNILAGASKVTASLLDNTPPDVDVAWAQQSNVAGISWTGFASINEVGTGYCGAVPGGGAAPTPAQLKAGSGGAMVGIAGTVTMANPALTYNCTVTGLTEATAYDFYFAAEDGVGNLTLVVSGPVPTSTPDVTPPAVDVAWSEVSNVAGTSWIGAASLNEVGTGYCVAVASGSVAPTAAEVKAGSGGGILGIRGMVVMANPATTYNCTVTGLTEATAYDFYFAAEDESANLHSDETVAAAGLTATTPDVNAPTVDVPWAQQSNLAGTSWTGYASLNEVGTGYCVAVPGGGVAPTPSQVKAGSGGAIVGTGGTVVMADPALTYNCTVTNLSEITAYNFYFVAEDGVPNLMAAVSGPISATTPDVTPPAIDVAWSEVSNVVGTSWTGSASIDETGTGYCAAVPNGSAAPTPAAIKAGSGDGIVGIRGSVAMPTPATTYNCTVTGLTEGVSYDFYFAAEDGVLNLMDAAVGPVSATTPDVSAPTIDVAWAQQSNTAGTSWTGYASLNEAGTGYCVAVPVGSAAPLATYVQAGSGGAIVGTGGSVVMADPAQTYNCTVTGLTEVTSYDFYFVAEDGVPNLMAAAVKTGPVTTPDVTPPAVDVAWAEVSNVTGSSWTGSASLNEAGTGYCAAVPGGSAAPTSAQIKDGSGGGIVGTRGTVAMPTAANTYACTVTGLSQATSYDFYFAAEDSVSNLMTIASGPVSAITPDLTPPTTTVALAFSASTVTSWTGTATINEDGTGYCAAITNGAQAPSALEVKNGSDANNQGTRGSVAMTGGVSAACTVTGLTTGTTYDFYFVAQDTAVNLQADANVSGPVTDPLP